MQALNAWLTGHDAGLLLEGPDPDSPEPLLHGTVIAQRPRPGAWLHRWDVVTVWLRDVPGLGGVREPRRPYRPTLTAAGEITEMPVGDAGKVITSPLAADHGI